MKRFLHELVFYLIPLLVLAAVILFPGFYSREFGFFDKTIDLQRDQRFGTIVMGYNEQTPYYKRSNADYYQADVIALGTSRVMQFKSEFFLTSFYNCGGAVEGNYSEYRNFLDNLKYDPEVVLIGLDPWVFNDEWNKHYNDYSDLYVPIKKTERSLPAMIKNMYSDFLEKKWSFRDLNNYPECYGFNGRINGDGYEPDGSYSYTAFYRDPVISNELRFKDTIDRIDNGVNRFEFGEHIDTDTLRQLDGFLSYCNEHDIYAVGFSAPFAPTVNHRMVSSGNYEYLSEIPSACAQVFEKYGFEYYDFTDVSFLGLTDEYYLDGFHGSDIVYATLLEEMVHRNSLLSDYVNQVHLNHRLETRYNTWIFDEPLV